MNEELLITSLGIKNFRSFDSNGIFLNNMNKINFLIGKNNSGKSNVLKFLRILSDTKGSLHNFPNSIENNHHNSNIGASISTTFLLNELGFPKTFVSQGIDYLIESHIANEIMFEYKIPDNEINIKVKNANRYWNSFDMYREAIGIAVINKLQIPHSGNSAWASISYYYKEIYAKEISALSKKVIYIPDKRVIQERHNIERSNSNINGTNLISELSKMKNYDIGEDANFTKLKTIEKKIAEILDVERIEIQIPEKSKQLVLVIDNKRLSLENYGTGVHDLVMLCCMLLINEQSLVCIEEPEIHMHPELQRRFIKFLSETEHQYIITTHSNTFLDYINSDVSVYHMKYDGVKSFVSKSITDNLIREVIDELGFKASDLLQTNGIIWVEGPSDRTYLNKWISLLDSEITEGIHYTIMFYGGKLLSHLSFESDEQNELIEMIKVNPNAFIIMDKDTSKINKTKERIINEISEDNSWITKGREIENYISLKVINRWLTKKKLVTITNENNLTGKFETLINSKNPNLKYETRKNIFAKEIADCFEANDLKYYDLVDNLKKIIDKIKKWNKK